MNPEAVAKEIFLAGVQSVLPEKMISNEVKLDGGRLLIGGQAYDLNQIRHVYVIGAGKASGLMASALERILAPRISDGLVIVKYGHGASTSKIRIREAAHPVPDENGFSATQELLSLAERATRDDLVIVLLSGGGSALLADFPEGSAPGEIQLLNTLLLRSGAAIQEINCVRKHLSRVKGGQLAKAVFPAPLACLILSDVVGDRLDVIASGPTVPDPSTFAEALRILEKYELKRSMPAQLLQILTQGAQHQLSETPKPGDAVFERVQNYLIGSNRMALEAAAGKAVELGFHAVIVDSKLDGTTDQVAQFILETATQQLQELTRPTCLLFGGEPTLQVTAGGLGGRSQHLALLAALALQGQQGITLLAAGTDGTDGPTDAAGAVVDGTTITRALASGLNPAKALQTFDSYHFFKQAGGHIITGPTKTNVMDMVVVLLQSPGNLPV